MSSSPFLSSLRPLLIFWPDGGKLSVGSMFRPFGGTDDRGSWLTSRWLLVKGSLNLLYACVFVYVSIHVSVYLVCVWCVYIYIYIYIYIYAHVFVLCVCDGIVELTVCIYIYIYIYIYACIYVCMYCLAVCIYTCIHWCACMYVSMCTAFEPLWMDTCWSRTYQVCRFLAELNCSTHAHTHTSDFCIFGRVELDSGCCSAHTNTHTHTHIWVL